jgi:hypothetical protein
MVPDVAEADAVNYIVNRVLTLKLYANNHVPVETDTAASYTEVIGGGYIAKTLTGSEWTITPNNPTIATYSAVQDFLFTGATGGSGQIYGLFVVDGDGLLRWSERFSESVLPFVPAADSLIRIHPKFQAS